MSETRILVVDDQEAIRKGIRNIIEVSKKYTVEEAVDGMECLDKVRKAHYDCIFLDIDMPRMNGTDALDRLKVLCPETPVIMISANQNLTVAVSCCRMGAIDYIEKPIEMQRILISLDNAINTAVLKTEQKSLKQKISQKNKSIEIIGESDAIKEVRHLIELAAKSDSAVLITGETGTGKELVAKWIHELSARSNKNFVEVNTSAITKELFESTMFGHKKGAFTGAVGDFRGKFEQAHEGSIFLDEIGDMDIEMQAKILRATEDFRITPLGHEKAIQVNVRLIAATNKDLEHQIEMKQFRDDLYFRLNTLQIHLPPLNDRREDIPLLVLHFSKLFANKTGLADKGFTEGALHSLMQFNWKGNIRSLRGMIERLYIYTDDKTIIDEKDIQDYVKMDTPNNSKKHKYYSIFSRFASELEMLDHMKNEYNVYSQLDNKKVFAH